MYEPMVVAVPPDWLQQGTDSEEECPIPAATCTDSEEVGERVRGGQVKKQGFLPWSISLV